MHRLLTHLETAAREWDIPPLTAQFLFWLPLAGAVFVAVARLNRQLYDGLTIEDGPIEWSQFFGYALASIAGLGISLRRLRAGHIWQGLLFAGFALGMCFVAGEEIAWGQRLFGLQTPAELSAINHQRELTVHNIQIVQDAFNVVLLIAGAFGTGAYFLNRPLQVERQWDQANYLFVPPLFLVPAFGVLFGYKLFRFIIWRTPGFTLTRYAEWPELCLALALCAFAFLNYRRLTRQDWALMDAQTANTIQQ